MSRLVRCPMVKGPHVGTFLYTLWMDRENPSLCLGFHFRGSALRVRHDWATSLSLFTFMHWRRKWQPTPVFLPGESRDGGAWWAAVYGVAQSRTWLKWLSSSSSLSRKSQWPWPREYSKTFFPMEAESPLHCPPWTVWKQTDCPIVELPEKLEATLCKVEVLMSNTRPWGTIWNDLCYCLHGLTWLLKFPLLSLIWGPHL